MSLRVWQGQGKLIDENEHIGNGVLVFLKKGMAKSRRIQLKTEFHQQYQTIYSFSQVGIAAGNINMAESCCRQGNPTRRIAAKKGNHHLDKNVTHADRQENDYAACAEKNTT